MNTEQDQAATFDAMVSGGKLFEYGHEALDKLNTLVKDKGRVLDFGCGEGVISESLDAARVFGVEISAKSLVLALRRGVPGAVADLFAGLPFADGTFDTIYCVHVLHHLGQAWGPIFDELSRVLRPGGNLVMVEPDARNLLMRWIQAPNSPLRVVPYNNEPAIYPAELTPHLDRLGYSFRLGPIDIIVNQAPEAPPVFPLWQRLLKAPFILILEAICWGQSRRFVIVAKKGVAP